MVNRNNLGTIRINKVPDLKVEGDEKIGTLFSLKFDHYPTKKKPS